MAQCPPPKKKIRHWSRPRPETIQVEYTTHDQSKKWNYLNSSDYEGSSSYVQILNAGYITNGAKWKQKFNSLFNSLI